MRSRPRGAARIDTPLLVPKTYKNEISFVRNNVKSKFHDTENKIRKFFFSRLNAFRKREDLELGLFYNIPEKKGFSAENCFVDYENSTT